MLTRRQFHAHLLGSLATLALLPPAALRAEAVPPADLWLNRLTFGATPQTRARFNQMGAAAWLEDQLSLPAQDPDLDQRLADARLHIAYPAGSDDQGHHWKARDELRPLSTLTAGPDQQLHCIDWTKGMDFSERARPANEVIAAALIRAVHAPAQLREVMTQFWHDHFCVNALKDEYTAAFFPSHDALLRAGALGNFRKMLGQVARSPAMLYFLNNADSRASPANENYARELLELHTLGAANYVNDQYASWHQVPGADQGLALGYMDLDVYEVARAFTGWSVGDGRYIDEGLNAPLTGAFSYVEAWHDPYQKRVLGVEFAPNRAPMEDGEQVLDILAGHPGTARLICTKLARRFLSDAPDPGLVDQLAGVFQAARDAPDQIAQTLRALVLHPTFAATLPGKLRRPFEVLAGLYRASGAQITGTENNQQWQLMRAGWRQHEYPVPTGHPDVMAAWTGASSLNRVVDLALYAHEDWFGVAKADLAAQEPDQTAGDLLEQWALRFGQTAGDLAQTLQIDPARPAASFSDDDRKGAAASAIAFAALTPQFLLR